VEDAVEGVQGVRDVSSSISRVRLQLQLSLNWTEISTPPFRTFRLKSRRRRVSSEASARVVKVNPEDQPIMFISVTGGDSVRDLMVYVESDLKDRFAGIEGVPVISFLGGFDRPNLRIWVDDAKLDKSTS